MSLFAPCSSRKHWSCKIKFRAGSNSHLAGKFMAAANFGNVRGQTCLCSFSQKDSLSQLQYTLLGSISSNWGFVSHVKPAFAFPALSIFRFNFLLVALFPIWLGVIRVSENSQKISVMLHGISGLTWRNLKLFAQRMRWWLRGNDFHPQWKGNVHKEF